MKYSNKGFRDNKIQINTPMNNTINNDINSAINREKKSFSNIKQIKDNEEFELPKIKTFQKEIWQKIYAKESGEILQLLRKSNENIRSSKIMLYDNGSNSNSYNIYNEKKTHEKNFSESQRIENSDNDYMHFFNPNNNFNNLEKLSSSSKNRNHNEEKSSEDDSVKELKTNFNNIFNKNNNDSSYFNKECYIVEDIIHNPNKILPKMVSFRKSKKKIEIDPNIPKSIEKSGYEASNEILVKTRGSLEHSIASVGNKIQQDEKSDYSNSKKNGFPLILKQVNKSSNLNNVNIQNHHLNAFSNKNIDIKNGNFTDRKIINNSNNTNKEINNIDIDNSNNLKHSPRIGPQNSNMKKEPSININNSNSNIFNSNNLDRNANIAFLNSSNNSNTLNSINKALYKKSNKFFCPHCEHCNVIKDENLEKYFNMKEAKNIVRKSLDFIVTNYQTDQSYLDFLLGNNNPGLSYLNYFNADSLYQINKNNNLHINNNEYENLKSLKKRTKFDIEVLLNTYPKHSNNRTVLQLVTHFLDALINDKVSLDSIAGQETFEKLKDSLISQGIAFKENEGEIEFDKELDTIFDESTKDKLRKLFKSIFFITI